MREGREKKILLWCGVVMVASEVVKQLLLTFVTEQGSYMWWYFPWQLCSIPMYVCIVAGLCRSEMIYDACLAFLSDFGLLAGICAFLDTSGFIYELAVLTIHSYVWHFVLIALGVYAWIIRAKRPRGNLSFVGALCIYLIGCAVAEIINVAAFDSGHRPIDMFYISPRYQMAQVFIRDMVPVIGNTGCIILYIVVTVVGALLIELIGRIILAVTSSNTL